MRLFSLLAALPLVLAAPVVKPKGGAEVIPGKYIAVLKEQTGEVSASVSKVRTFEGVEPEKDFGFGSFKGFSFSADEKTVGKVADLPEVAYVEPDTKVYASALTTQNGAPYGLARISHRRTGTTSYIYDSTAGSGTYSYIIDTGIYTAHRDFGGRATFGANFVDSSNTDGNGHGTHVAGTTGSTTYGVAKRTNLIAVKVLGADGSGSNSGVLQGISWAANNAASNGRIGRAVANLSLGGPFQQSSNDGVAAAVRQGLFMAVAAGNEGQDTRNVSPGSEPTACTVGATDSTDRQASFSNFGSLVDVFAPGVNILSTWIGGPTATNTISGTSMASPHVAGLGAYLLALEGARSPAALCSRIVALSTKNVIVGIRGTGTPNAVAYNGNGA
ncbi:MAG: subtilisin-like serine protease [Alyxoria varia]|nr:MAG: subtilisin-like serine protease [Alyxoria varia]